MVKQMYADKHAKEPAGGLDGDYEARSPSLPLTGMFPMGE